MADIRGKGTLYKGQYGWSVSQTKKDQHGNQLAFYIPVRFIKNALARVAFDYKLVNYRSFLLKNPIVGHVYAMYKADSIKIQDENDVIDLPNSMTDALLNYVAYMSHSSINKEGVSEADTWHRKFNASCVELDMKGYRVPLNTESLSVQDRGFK